VRFVVRLCLAKIRSLVVSGDVFVHQALQISLIEHDYVLEQVAAATPDPSFRNSILPWTLKTGAFGAHTEVLDRGDNTFAQVGGSIRDQIAESRVIGNASRNC
jgi:hypothetical protein